MNHRAILVAVTAIAAIAGAAWPASASGTTEVTLIVRGCEGCTIGMVRALSADGSVQPSRPQFWEGGTVSVTNGKATFQVPTAITPGVSFTIAAPWEGDTGRVSNIVLGNAPRGGQSLDADQARSRKRATACWAGTTAIKATIRVSVAKVKVQGYTGLTTGALAWASPTIPTVGRLNTTDNGTLGNQDAYYC